MVALFGPINAALLQPHNLLLPPSRDESNAVLNEQGSVPRVTLNPSTPTPSLCCRPVFRDRYSLVLHVILSIGTLTYYVPVMDAGDDLAHAAGGMGLAA